MISSFDSVYQSGSPSLKIEVMCINHLYPTTCLDSLVGKAATLDVVYVSSTLAPNAYFR